eukprot:4562054-Pleurochrysis_carterae.AAC.2
MLATEKGTRASEVQAHRGERRHIRRGQTRKVAEAEERRTGAGTKTSNSKGLKNTASTRFTHPTLWLISPARSGLAYAGRDSGMQSMRPAQPEQTQDSQRGHDNVTPVNHYVQPRTHGTNRNGVEKMSDSCKPCTDTEAAQNTRHRRMQSEIAVVNKREKLGQKGPRGNCAQTMEHDTIVPQQYPEVGTMIWPWTAPSMEQRVSAREAEARKGNRLRIRREQTARVTEFDARGPRAGRATNNIIHFTQGLVYPMRRGMHMEQGTATLRSSGWIGQTEPIKHSAQTAESSQAQQHSGQSLGGAYIGRDGGRQNTRPTQAVHRARLKTVKRGPMGNGAQQIEVDTLRQAATQVNGHATSGRDGKKTGHVACTATADIRRT